jgi:hypothetical protein
MPGVRVVLDEDATRFARDLMAQELGIGVLIKLGMRVITANGDDLTETDDHMKVAMRQIAGAFSQLEKARLVAKLKAARDRKREANGKCEAARATPKARRKLSRWPSGSMLRGYRIARSVRSLPSLATSRALASRMSPRRCRKCLRIRKQEEEAPAIASACQEPPGLPVQTGVLRAWGQQV